MPDTFSHEARSKVMSRVHGKDTQAEVSIRKALFKRGFRYRLYSKSLPGTPDLVFPKYEAVIQINGCFWHGHNCHLFKWPSTNAEFWEKKISSNQARDLIKKQELESLGFRVLTIWGCALKGKLRLSFDEMIEGISNWLVSQSPSTEILHR